jgi:ankyrin repeat protein
MAAIANLGFAIQAADVGTRSILGVHRNFRNVRSERAGRVEEVLRTIETYENAIENLSCGGAALVAESDQLLRSHIAKIVGTMKELKALFLDADLEMQACPDAIEAQVIDDAKWLRFQSLKSELEVCEKGFQFLAMSRILRYGSVRYLQSQSTLSIHKGSINGNITATTAPIYDDADSPSDPYARPHNGKPPGSLCFNPSAGELSETTSALDPSLLSLRFVRARRSDDVGSSCTNNRCLCRCHQQVASSWGYLHMLHTQPSSIRTSCNRPSCKNRSLEARALLDLSWMKISFAIITSLQVFWGLGGFSIKPSLDVKRVVAPDSRGFQISDKFRTGQYSAEEAVEAFRKAFRNGEASLMDLTPDGQSLTESLMEITSLKAAQESCRDITYLLKTIAGHSALMECLPAVFKFCETAFEFGGVDPFDIVDELGLVYDVAEEDILWFHQVIFYHDPFGIKWLQRCLRKCPGFANVPRLIQEILFGDPRTSTSNRTAFRRSINETFLGLSALHWASCSESWVRWLLDAGHDVSVVDQHGRSPLVYAAAYGLLGTFMALLEAGADPTSSYRRRSGHEGNFLRDAMYYGHLPIVLGSIDFFRRDSIGRFDIAQTLLDQALGLVCRYLNFTGQRVGHYRLQDRPERAAIVQRLLALGANPDIFQDDGDNLLHQPLASYTGCASLILWFGTKHLDVGTTTGETPAMRAAHEANAPLLHLYLQNGARLQSRDNHGRNAVHYAIREFHRDLSSMYSDHLFWTYSTFKILLSYNADPNVGDYCRCACSWNGCTPSTMLMKQLFHGYRTADFRPSELVLSIEWVLMLQELVSYNAAEKAFAECARFLSFHISGLTHVCCRAKVFHMSRWQESPIDQEDISEILDEEEELIATLEEDLETLRPPFDKRDPAEAWADKLVDFVKRDEELPRSSGSTKISFRHALLHYRDESNDLLRAVYQDEALFLVRFEQRQALVRRCFNRLKAEEASTGGR